MTETGSDYGVKSFLKMEERTRKLNWLFLADVIDRLVLICYCILITFTPVIMFVIVPLTHNGVVSQSIAS